MFNPRALTSALRQKLKRPLPHAGDRNEGRDNEGPDDECCATSAKPPEALHAKCDLNTLAQRVILPVMPITDEEQARAGFQDRGQKLARQDMWDVLSREIHEADATRTATPGGEPAAMLLAYGARGDVVAVAQDALFDGVIPRIDGIAAFEAMLGDHPDDYATALVVAMTHIDIAWAWRTAPEADALGDETHRARAFHRHFARAARLLSPYCGLEENAPSLAAAQCALLAGQAISERQVGDDYEDLIDLDPHSPSHMRALGRALLPECHGSYAQLELEARRTASRVQDVWGAGGYAWVYLDALALDRGCLNQLEPAFFAEGLRDILSRRPSQHYANLLAAFCAVTMRPDAASGTPPLAGDIQNTLEWILSDQLHELHPLIWTQALHSPGQVTPLPSRKALISEGRQTALRAIAAIFADDMADGSSIAFSPAGMYRLPAI